MRHKLVDLNLSGTAEGNACLEGLRQMADPVVLSDVEVVPVSDQPTFSSTVNCDQDLLIANRYATLELPSTTQTPHPFQL